MANRRVLISGASVGGPALALWLTRYGFDVTVVEKAAETRPGGQAVDFKGDTHRTVLKRMGIYDDVERMQTGGSGDGAVVDRDGRRIATVPGEFSAGELEIARGDLARLLYERTAGTSEYLFDDSITALSETVDGVDVTFSRASARTFDLVIGADGMHSNVRRLAFGPERDFVEYLGYYYALADVHVDDGDEMYNEPGRMAATGGVKAPAFFVFASDPLDFDRGNVEQQKEILVDAYRGSAWKVPRLLAQLPDATEFYLDSISRATTQHYARGRVALLGDSAYGNALGGFGTGLAIVGAYVLAGELKRADGDHAVAYARYEERFRDYAKVAKKVNAGRLLAPRTSLGLRARNLMFSTAARLGAVTKVFDKFATDIELPDYEADRQHAF